MWIARNDTQELWVFNEKPYLKEDKNGNKYWWVDGTDYCYSSLILDDVDVYPEVTFENSPQEVILQIKDTDYSL